MATTFHPFPQLPFELRATIWDLTVEPRTVEVRIHYEWHLPEDEDDYPWERLVPYIVSTTPAPAVLQVCQESRKQKVYHKALTELNDPDSFNPRYVWLNWDLDTLSIGTSEFTAFALVARNIQRLRFEREVTFPMHDHEMEDLYVFTSIKQLQIAPSEDGLYGWRDEFGPRSGTRFERFWPCPEDNVFLVDPSDGHLIKGKELKEVLEQRPRKEIEQSKVKVEEKKDKKSGKKRRRWPQKCRHPNGNRRRRLH